MVKNLMFLTAIFGFLEAIIYVFGLAVVLTGEQSIAGMVVYAIGFSIGLVLGNIIDRKLAIGYTSFQVNINHENVSLVKKLREQGYGVTVYDGEGKNGHRYKLEILTKRKREDALVATVLKYEKNAFIQSFEPKRFHGGYLSDLMSKRTKRKRQVKKDSFGKQFFVKKAYVEINQEVNILKNDWDNKI